MRPIEPIRPSLDSDSLLERFEFADPDGVVQKHDFKLDAARSVTGFAPYLECWEQHRRRSRLPSIQDFDAVREAVGIVGVHLVDIPSTDVEDLRFLNFDSTTRPDGLDFSGTLVAEYPDPALRQAALMDYWSSVTTGHGRFTRLDVNRTRRRGKFARLVLPISDTDSTKASKLLVIVRLLEHRESKAARVGTSAIEGEPRVGGESGRISGSIADGFDPHASPRGAPTNQRMQDLEDENTLIGYFHSGFQERLADRDLLEWLLRQSSVAEDQRELAALLIDRFGSLPAVLAMGRERLAEFPGMTTQALLSLKVVRELATRIVRLETINKPVVSDGRHVLDYCRARMAHETVEHVRILYLDQKNRLISDEAIHGGGVSSVPINPRHVVRRAVILDAQSIIMAHNHPSGDPSPSGADLDVTADVKRAAEAVGIRLLDHLIIGRSGHVSLRTLGHLDGD